VPIRFGALKASNLRQQADARHVHRGVLLVARMKKGQYMPLKLNIGLSRKMGEANYGSRGASLNVELEVDSSLVGEPAKLQERIRQLFGLVRTSLTEELNGNNGKAAIAQSSNQETRSRPTTGNGQPTNQPNGSRGKGRPSTQSQIKAIFGISRRQRLELAPFLQERFHVNRPDDLTIQEASQVIDQLKSADAAIRR